MNAGQLECFQRHWQQLAHAIYTKKMAKQRLVSKRGSDSSLWLKVAAAATADERDDWMQVLQRTFHRQAEFLSEIPATMWQNCEQLKLGYATHFSMTNNVAESFGSQWAAGSAFILCSRSNIPSNGSNLLVFLEVR